MVDPVNFLCCFLCFSACLLRVLRKYLSMAVSSSNSSGVAVVASSPWKKPVAEVTAAATTDADASNKRPREDLPSTGMEDDSGVAEKVVRDRRRPPAPRIAIPIAVDHREDAPGRRTEGLLGGVEKKVVTAMMTRERKRPARIVVPVIRPAGFAATETEAGGRKEMEEVGAGYCLASRRGSHRQVMEDGYGVISDINGDSKQAFFGVFDGHGGRAAVDFVSAKLGKNILAALDELKKAKEEVDDRAVQLAIKEAYMTTDKEFLSQGLSSGVCAATVLLKDGDLHVANAGDCRVVLCRKGATADALTDDHRAAREDERDRIENSGGFVTCRNGVWRVQDSLAVSRAIGDGGMKEWVTAEPESRKIQMIPDCEFLILASDGLWDKVTNQEAVDVVVKQGGSLKSCKELIEMTCRRGNRDDVTVMVVRLEKFMKNNHRQSG